MKNAHETTLDNKSMYGIQAQDFHKILLKIGISPSLFGYTYLINAMGLIFEDPDLLHYITKGLYIDVAGLCSSTPSRVERSIRHAISVACLHGNAAFIDDIFGNSINPEKGTPTNTQFLAGLYFYMTR